MLGTICRRRRNTSHATVETPTSISEEIILKEIMNTELTLKDQDFMVLK